MQKLVLSIITIEMMLIFNSCAFPHDHILLQRPVYANSINYDYSAYLKYANAGLEFKEKGQYEQAIQQFQLAITKKPDEYAPFMFIGDIYLDQEKYGLAIDKYNEAISISPYQSSLYYRRGAAFERIRKYYSALKDYNYSITLNSNEVQAYRQRSILYAHLDEKEKAIKDCNKAIQLEPSYRSYDYASLLYSILRNHQKSIEYCQKALAIAPITEKDKMKKILMEENENYKASIALSNPTDESAGELRKAAAFNNINGNYEKAYKYAIKALKLEPKNSYALCDLGISLVGQYKIDEGIKNLTKGIEYAKDNKLLLSRMYMERGHAYLKKHDYILAIADFNKSLSYEERSDTYYWRGETYRQIQDYNKAYADYQKAVDIWDWSYKAYYALEEINPYVTVK